MKKSSVSKIIPKVVQGEKEISVEVIADSIISISKGIEQLRNSRLNDKALVLLIQNVCPLLAYGKRVGATEVRAVLQGIQSLKGAYLK